MTETSIDTVYSTSSDFVEEQKEESPTDVPKNEKHPYYGGKTVNLPPDKIIDLSKEKEPKPGETLYTENGKSFKLVKQLGKGGEGTVYSTSLSGLVAKILFNINVGGNNPTLNRTKNKQAKIEYMISHPIKNSLVVWPVNAVYDSANKSTRKFLGYTMPSLENGIELKKIITQMGVKGVMNIR